VVDELKEVTVEAHDDLAGELKGDGGGVNDDVEKTRGDWGVGKGEEGGEGKGEEAGWERTDRGE
jgi:hypothetical protein